MCLFQRKYKQKIIPKKTHTTHINCTIRKKCTHTKQYELRIETPYAQISTRIAVAGTFTVVQTHSVYTSRVSIANETQHTNASNRAMGDAKSYTQ